MRAEPPATLGETQAIGARPPTAGADHRRATHSPRQAADARRAAADGCRAAARDARRPPIVRRGPTAAEPPRRVRRGAPAEAAPPAADGVAGAGRRCGRPGQALPRSGVPRQGAARLGGLAARLHRDPGSDQPRPGTRAGDGSRRDDRRPRPAARRLRARGRRRSRHAHRAGVGRDAAAPVQVEGRQGRRRQGPRRGVPQGRAARHHRPRRGGRIRDGAAPPWRRTQGAARLEAACLSKPAAGRPHDVRRPVPGRRQDQLQDPAQRRRSRPSISISARSGPSPWSWTLPTSSRSSSRRSTSCRSTRPSSRPWPIGSWRPKAPTSPTRS